MTSMLVDTFEVGAGPRVGTGTGARVPLGEDTDVRATFTRTLSGAGRAQVTLSYGQLGTAQNRAVGGLRDWHDELVIRVDGADAFVGPVIDVVKSDRDVRITAEDYSACWRRAFLPGPFPETTDDALTLVDAAFAAELRQNASVDPTRQQPWRPIINGARLGRDMTIVVDEGDDMPLEDVIKSAVDVGWAWTWVGTTLLTGFDGEIRHNGNRLVVRLTDEDWADPPLLRRAGADRATRVIVYGEAGVRAVATAQQSYIDYYGLVTKTVDRTDVRTYEAAMQIARLELSKSVDPVRPETARLARSATVPVSALIPGSVVYASSDAWTGEQPTIGCVLSAVSVGADGSVSVQFDPLTVTDVVAGVEAG